MKQSKKDLIETLRSIPKEIHDRIDQKLKRKLPTSDVAPEEIREQQLRTLAAAKDLESRAGAHNREMTESEDQEFRALVTLVELDGDALDMHRRVRAAIAAGQIDGPGEIPEGSLADWHLGERAAPAVRSGWVDDRGREIRVLSPKEPVYTRSLFPEKDREHPIRFGFGELVRAMVMGSSDKSVLRALSEGTDSAGGYTVPDVLATRLVDRMRAATRCIQAGAMTVPLTSDVTKIARLATDPVAAWRLENAAIAESDPTFEGVQFTARSLAVLVKVSRELLDDTVNVGQALELAFAGAMAVELDRVALRGSGTPPEPRGIKNTTNVNSVSMGTNGAALANYDKLLDTLYENMLDNAPGATAAIMHPRTEVAFAKLKDSQNQPLQRPPMVANLPFLSTTGVEINETQGSSGAIASRIYAGHYPHLLIGVRTSLRVEILKELFAGNHQYGFIAHLRADIAVEHPESFSMLVGIIP